MPEARQLLVRIPGTWFLERAARRRLSEGDAARCLELVALGQPYDYQVDAWPALEDACVGRARAELGPEAQVRLVRTLVFAGEPHAARWAIDQLGSPSHVVAAHRPMARVGVALAEGDVASALALARAEPLPLDARVWLAEDLAARGQDGAALSVLTPPPVAAPVVLPPALARAWVGAADDAAARDRLRVALWFRLGQGERAVAWAQRAAPIDPAVTQEVRRWAERWPGDPNARAFLHLACADGCPGGTSGLPGAP